EGVARRDPANARARLETLGLADDPALVEAMVAVTKSKDAPAVARWLDDRPPELRRLVGGGLVRQWVQVDPAAALTWALAHGVPFAEQVRDPDIPRSVLGGGFWPRIAAANRAPGKA